MPQPASSARGLRRVGWLVGLLPLAGIWAGLCLWSAPRIATQIEGEGAGIAARTATATGEPWLRITARGRDLLVEGEAPDPASRSLVLAALYALDSPRQIVSRIGLVETASPFRWTATRNGPASIALEGSRPAEMGRKALEVEVTGAIGSGTTLRDEAHAALGAPQDFAAAAVFLAARLPSLAPGARVSLSDTVLSITGEAVDLAAYDSLRAAFTRPPEGFTLGTVDIQPPRIAHYRFAIVRSQGGVALNGFVPSEAARQAALAAAASLGEAGSVEDRLQTARGLPDSVEPKALLGAMIQLAGLIQAGQVVYEDGALSVSGDAIDPQAIGEAQALIRDGRPAGVKAGTVTLAARPLSPYRVTLRRTAEALTVSGHLPDEDMRRRVLAILRQRSYREPVIDRSRLAEGAPVGLGDALAAGAAMLTTLVTGEVNVTDRTLRLTGESLYRGAAAAAPGRLAETLPVGWTAATAVSPREPEDRRDAQSCRQGVAAATATADLRFPVGSTTLTPAFYPALDALASLGKVCPDLRLAVSGPADPPGAKPAPSDEAKKPAPKPAASKPAAGKPAKQEPGKAEPAKAASETSGEAKPAEEEPSGLARQRALALVEYLLQAGLRPGQVTTGPDREAGPAVVALAP